MLHKIRLCDLEVKISKVKSRDRLLILSNNDDEPCKITEHELNLIAKRITGLKRIKLIFDEILFDGSVVCLTEFFVKTKIGYLQFNNMTFNDAICVFPLLFSANSRYLTYLKITIPKGFSILLKTIDGVIGLDNCVSCNYYLKDVEITNDEIIKQFDDTYDLKIQLLESMRTMMNRNKIHSRVRSTVLHFLLLRLCCRDVSVIIAKKVWKTRDDIIWKPLPKS